MPFVSCNKFNTSQAKQDQAIADLEQELLNKQNALNDCSGNPLAGTVPTCAQMTAAIADAVGGVSTTPTGAAGGDLEGTYPNPTVKDQAIVDAVTGSTAVQTAVAGVFNRCDGTDMPAGASLIECSAKGTDIPYLVNGVIPATQLPAYVDDVLEFPALANFPATGEAGKIYIDAGTGKTYRWNGTGYTEISASAGITVQDEGSVLTTAATSLNFVGSGINATSSGGAVTVTVPSATTTQSGTTELATDAETVAGTSTTLAVTPAGVKAAIDAIPPHGTNAQPFPVTSVTEYDSTVVLAQITITTAGVVSMSSFVDCTTNTDIDAGAFTQCNLSIDIAGGSVARDSALFVGGFGPGGSGPGGSGPVGGLPGGGGAATAGAWANASIAALPVTVGQVITILVQTSSTNPTLDLTITGGWALAYIK